MSCDAEALKLDSASDSAEAGDEYGWVEHDSTFDDAVDRCASRTRFSWGSRPYGILCRRIVWTDDGYHRPARVRVCVPWAAARPARRRDPRRREDIDDVSRGRL